MKNSFVKQQIRQDFDQAYQLGLFKRIISRIQGKSNSLLSFHEVMKYVKIKNELYKGMQFIHIDDIIGSEGRYNDFNKEFLPKRRNLRSRWQRVDEAHYEDKILPPIKVYQLGKAYFVRDGNHRVSVARKQKRDFIDAEVTLIKSDIEITPDMTKNDLIDIIVSHEKKVFLDMTKLDQYRDISMLNFTFPGRYDEIMSHIQGHQYFLGIDKNEVITFHDAMLSWYDNLFHPIIEEIEKAGVLIRFPNRTAADLYVWTIRRWDELKNKYGNDVKIRDAITSYSKEYGVNPVINLVKSILNLFKK